MFRITKSNEANIQVTVIDDDDMLENQLREDGNGAAAADDPFEKWYLIN